MSQTVKYSFLFIILMAVANIGFAQLSPGELSEAHAHLEGLTNCTRCHDLNKKETTSKCLDCHSEIRKLIEQKKGLHATVAASEKECHDCHGEHFGRDFQIVRFEKDTFTHRLAGFELQGKHAEIKCIDCHKSALIKNKISQKKGDTWLGLGTACLDCHNDYHQNTLSDDCLSCHNQTTFRPATEFDHSKSDFPLIGKHQTVDCKKCHKLEQRNGQEFQQFANIEFAKCTDCHQDVHQNKFGQDCRKCHSEFSFYEVKQLLTFNHEQTDYPLRGKHRAVDCKKCHTSGRYTRDLNHQRCTYCHNDYHEGQFKENGVVADCAGCHSVEGFTPSAFDIEKHNKTSFPLEGAHLATPCFTCHKKAEKWNFEKTGTDCRDCHNNIHKTYLDEKHLAGGGCKNCHSVMTWKEVKFDHKKTSFNLQGKHAGLGCRSCHFANNDENEPTQQFTWKNQSCTNCHKDVHFDQFEKDGTTDCERCHTFSSWKPEKFDHERTQFKLDGKHADLACTKCHKPNNDLTENYIVYKFEDISCKSCH